MVLTDDRILEYLRENETGGATEMANSGLIRYSRGYISQRLSKLSKHGLVEHLGNGVYRITERGERYLDGEIDTSEDMPDEIPEESDGPNADMNDTEV